MAPQAVLVGLPGSGKSTVGRRLAKLLGVTLCDTDIAIEKKTGRSVADIFADDGQEGFRQIEEQVIREALHNHNGVVCLGGGAVTSPGVRAALAGHVVVFLEISTGEGIRRTGKNAKTVRPLLAGPDHANKYRALANERVPLYRQVATMRVNANRHNPAAVARHLASQLSTGAEQEHQVSASDAALDNRVTPAVLAQRCSKIQPRGSGVQPRGSGVQPRGSGIQ